MDERELLEAAERVLVQAIEEAEFTRLPKDLQYAQAVIDKINKRRAEVTGVQFVTVLSMVGGRVWRQDTCELLQPLKNRSLE